MAGFTPEVSLASELCHFTGCRRSTDSKACAPERAGWQYPPTNEQPQRCHASASARTEAKLPKAGEAFTGSRHNTCATMLADARRYFRYQLPTPRHERTRITASASHSLDLQPRGFARASARGRSFRIYRPFRIKRSSPDPESNPALPRRGVFSRFVTIGDCPRRMTRTGGDDPHKRLCFCMVVRVAPTKSST